MQAPQLGEGGRARPEKHAAAGRRAQRLLRRPQCVAVPGSLDDDDAGQVDAGRGERRRIGQVGRGDPDDEFALRGQLRQRRAEDAQLTYAFVLRQDFGQGTARPAAARQFGVQRRKARGDAGAAA